ncbi:MAG TPA: alpha/beta hydrolase [Cytophagales bacterium]|nr:alpha/beta hydrolase [Cytophagales bacterium]
MELKIKQESDFKYIDEGQGDVLLLLHGLFGALSNWEGVVKHFSKKYRVVIPMMPIYEMPLKESSVEGLVKYIERFVDFKNLSDLTLLGNSLGGHIALIYALNNPENVRRMVLTGSSGLFEDSMGGSFPKRGNYEYIKERVIYTFYDPKSATKELIDEVFDITNNNQKCLRIINIARSAQRHNLAKDLPKIEVPTLLIWGLNDTITPPEVAHEFQRLLPNAELKFIDKCCHAAMMEHPEKFNLYLESFLEKTTAEHVS